MASAKQIKARKLFAMRSKRGDFKKAITKAIKFRQTFKSKKSKSSKSKKSNPHPKKTFMGIEHSKAFEGKYKPKPKTKLKVSDIGDFMTPVKKPEFFEKKDKGKYMILLGFKGEWTMPYRDPFTSKQLVDTLPNVQRIAFLLNSQGEKVQIITS
jgi:hypothetical protein